MSNELIAGFGGALIGSVVTGIVAWILQRAQEASRREHELRSVVMVLVDLRKKFDTEIAPMTDFLARERVEGYLTAKRTVYLEAADTLIKLIPKRISSSEYNILAWEHMWDSNFKAAEKYFLRAVGAAHSILSKINALRAIASFYFAIGPQTDFEKGRDYYQKAVSQLPEKPSDPYSVYTLGFSYEKWGWSELYNGFEAKGRSALDIARKYYRDLPDDHPLKNAALGSLEAKLQSQKPIAPPTPSLAATAHGVQVPPLPAAPP
jgi:tetratricopeptide (TPR) repeat protein